MKNIPSIQAIEQILNLIRPYYRVVFLKLYTMYILLGRLTPNNFLQVVTDCDFQKIIYDIEHGETESTRENALEIYHSLIYDRIDSYQRVLNSVCDMKPSGKNKAELQKVIEIFKKIKEQVFIKIDDEDL